MSASGMPASVPVVAIYTLRGCGYCRRAKALLDAKQVPYTECDVTVDPVERERVTSLTGHRTFPQIFIDDRFVGGCDELHALERSGDLNQLLARTR